MGPGNIARLNIYTTDMAAFMAAAEQLAPIWANDGAAMSCSLIGVERLFDPDLMIELAAAAVA